MNHRLSFVAAGSLSLVIAFAAPSAAASMFRDNAAYRGVYASPRPPTLRTLKWRFRSGGGVIASPTIDNGVVYVGSEDHWLYAIRVADGSLEWKFQTQGAVNSTAAVADGRVFFGSLDGHVYALNAKAGTLLWRFATGGERRYTSSALVMPTTQLAPDAFDVLLSSPAAVSGIVLSGAATITSMLLRRQRACSAGSTERAMLCTHRPPLRMERYTSAAGIGICTSSTPTLGRFDGNLQRRTSRVCRAWSEAQARQPSSTV